MVLPIVDAFVALIGLIVYFALQAIHKETSKQDTPQEAWIKNTGTDFV